MDFSCIRGNLKSFLRKTTLCTSLRAIRGAHWYLLVHLALRWNTSEIVSFLLFAPVEDKGSQPKIPSDDTICSSADFVPSLKTPEKDQLFDNLRLRTED